MGSYYTYCPHCGEEFSARWDFDVHNDGSGCDDADSKEPFAVTLQRVSHDCLALRFFLSGYYVVQGLIGMALAIRANEARKRHLSPRVVLLR